MTQWWKSSGNLAETESKRTLDSFPAPDQQILPPVLAETSNKQAEETPQQFLSTNRALSREVSD